MGIHKNKYILFGPGSMAEKHFHEFSKRNTNLLAVYSPTVIKNKCFSKLFRIDNMKHLDNLDFDFGVITSPNIFHYEHIEYLLKRNKPVFVEKPMVINLKQFENLNKYYDLSNIFVSFNLRYLEQTNSLFQTDFHDCQDIEIKWIKNLMPNNSWSLNKDLSGGGILIDWGTHAIDLLCYLFNEELKFKSIQFHEKENDIDLSFELKLKCEERNINIQMSWIEKNNNIPFSIYFNNKKSKIVWKKNDLSLSRKKDNINYDYKKYPNMYDYFIDTYLNNYENTWSIRKKNRKTYIECIALIDKCYQYL
jgi:hypothetical protein